FTLMRLATGLGRTDAAAVAAHYGSISVVTFVAGSQFVLMSGLGYSGSMVAVMALMETPAIVVGLVLARGGGAPLAPSRRRAARRKLI
ncbi:sodium-dependent bicarbonate transport family permease, partial [Tritonibacter sp. SIMBA_163]|uniref:sodium-dependent bicarbonate transport family permease n=1 Tax=Tritonibacter sp. SIMBA_163 TaxID=3080868 RepID=UPI00397F2232